MKPPLEKSVVPNGRKRKYFESQRLSSFDFNKRKKNHNICMSTIVPQMISLSHFFLILFLNTLYSVQTADQHYLYTFDSSSKWTFSEVQSKPLTPFQETLSKGLKSGVYWIQIPPNSTSQVFVIENHRIKTPKAFSGSTPLRM